MSYSKITLQTAIEQFELNLVDEPFLPPSQPIVPSPYLQMALDRGLSLALANDTEKARSDEASESVPT